MKIYLASPLGFSELGRLGLDVLKIKLVELGHEIHDPWEQDQTVMIDKVFSGSTYNQVLTGCADLVYGIGDKNRVGIDWSDCVFAVLDGQELDSGTVSELAYTVGKGKRAYGYRGDFRSVDGLPGVPFNLQVIYFINYSGGKLFRSIEEIDF